jgi:tetratricopeptide (TPR) repeat protein
MINTNISDLILFNNYFEEIELMRLTNLTIRDLITPDSKLTFLAGAGCSMDPPSCLSAGKPMMKAIINYVCADSEIEKILKLEDLRFEQLVEIVRDRLDKELKIIDYYGQCDKPNLQHFFLAEMIKNGHFVMTTNFDFLIEYALQQSGVPNEVILPVITKNDYQSYSKPDDLLSKGKKTLYKIHGSTKNIVSLENTRDSLVATIQAFGSNKEGENVFQVEPFKRPLFENISSGRSLVVIGYSGSDDFDIVPTLMVLKNLKNIVWINYIQDDGGKEKIYEINNSTLEETENSDKVNQILSNIYRMHNTDYVYRMNVNTTRLIKELIDIKPNLSSNNFSLSPMSWLKNTINPPDEFEKYFIPFKIYNDFDIFDDAMDCLKRILEIAEHKKNKKWKSIALNNIGMIYRAQGSYPEALIRFEEALQIEEQLGGLRRKAIALNNIGMIYRAQGNYPEALIRFEEALQIDEQLGNLNKKAIALNNIGGIHFAHGNYPEALKRIEQALQIAEQLGDLSRKAEFLNNIGRIYKEQGNYPKALKRYQEALQIAEQLGDLSGKATFLNNIGTIYKEQGNYSEALKWFEKALQIAEQLGDLSVKATFLNNIGLIHYTHGNYQKALKRYEEALQIDKQLEDLSGKAIRLNNIASIHYAQGDYLEALTYFQENLSIREQLKETPNIALCLWWIGAIYGKLNDTSKALKNFERALEIYEQLGLENRIQQVREVISDLKS